MQFVGKEQNSTEEECVCTEGTEPMQFCTGAVPRQSVLIQKEQYRRSCVRAEQSSTEAGCVCTRQLVCGARQVHSDAPHHGRAQAAPVQPRP
eukprot:2762054-Rhodomonas_salina.1